MIFNEPEVLRKFDKLVDLGVIHHAESTVVPLVDDGFAFEFRVCQSWKRKPMTVDDSHNGSNSNNSQQNGGGSAPKATETFGPGSDIDKSHPDQVIGTINDTHVVALNIYPVFRPQYLLLTLNSHRSQNENLDFDDVAATWEFLHAVGSPMYAMYNCTRHAGCSRYHKHVQVLPKPQAASDSGFTLFPDNDAFPMDRVPFVFYFKRFNSDAGNGAAPSPQPPQAEAVFDAYQQGLASCKELLGPSHYDAASPFPHNVIMTGEWILVIPRRGGGYPRELMVNAAGMMGMPTVSDASGVDAWREAGPVRLLRQFGYVLAQQQQGDGAGGSSVQ